MAPTLADHVIDPTTPTSSDCRQQAGRQDTGSAGVLNVVERIAAFSKRHRAASVTAVFPVSVPDALILSLLDMPLIESVILAEAPDASLALEPERVGWFRVDGRLARMPSRVGDLILAYGDGEAFGFELAKMSLRRGGRTIAFDSPLGFTKPRSLRSLLLSRCLRGANRALRRKVRNAIHSDKAGPFGPVLVRSYRRLSTAIETKRDRKNFVHLAKLIRETPVSDRSIKGRLAVVTGSLGPGGAERQVVNTLQGLAARNVGDIHLIAERLSPAPYDFYLPELEGQDGLSISELGAASTRDDTALLAFAQMIQHAPGAFRMEILKLVSVFRRLRPEVVHAWQDGPAVKAGLAAVLAGVDRVILGWRTLSPIMSGLYHPSYRSIVQALATRDNVVMLNNSAAGAKSYADWLGFEPGRIQVIRNGLNFSGLTKPAPDAIGAYRDSLGLDATSPVIGTILRFGAEKRPMLWVQTAAKVAERRPDVHFLMIGDGPLHESVRSAATALGLEGRIHMPGRTTTPASALALMDLFLLTSLYEGLPNVLVEAGAMGVPVVSTDVGGVRETFIHGETGFAVGASQPSALADEVIKLLDDQSWRQDAGRLSPIWVKKRFGFERMIDETLDMYGLSVADANGVERLDVA